MTVAIHQPNYLPWLGYFSKIHLSDVFVFHDAVQFTDRGYTKRTRIRKAKHSASTTWLTVPVKQHASDTPVSDIEIDNSTNWQQSHLRKIENTYSGTAYFSEVFPQIEHALEDLQTCAGLSEFNMSLVRRLCTYIGIHAEWRSSSQLQRTGSGKELNLSIVSTLGGSTYLSGTGAQAYQQEDSFKAEGIELRYNDVLGWLREHPYQQGEHPFVEGLSIVDTLMHVGVPGVIEILKSIAMYDARTW